MHRLSSCGQGFHREVHHLYTGYGFCLSKKIGRFHLSSPIGRSSRSSVPPIAKTEAKQRGVPCSCGGRSTPPQVRRAPRWHSLGPNRTPDRQLEVVGGRLEHLLGPVTRVKKKKKDGAYRRGGGPRSAGDSDQDTAKAVAGACCLGFTRVLARFCGFGCLC